VFPSGKWLANGRLCPPHGSGRGVTPTVEGERLSTPIVGRLPASQIVGMEVEFISDDGCHSSHMMDAIHLR
jgi:hypothetical protein